MTVDEAFKRWWIEQTRIGDPARRPNLSRDAFLAGFEVGRNEMAKTAEIMAWAAEYPVDDERHGERRTLSDALFDACCAMKAEEEMAREWENGAVERMNYLGRRS